MQRRTFIAMLFVLAVSISIPTSDVLFMSSGQAASNVQTDVDTAIFKETEESINDKNVMKELYPFKGVGKPDDIAKMAVVLASDDASWMTGACVAVDGGYTAR
jgi:NAD(P)-dependent dehydrogenase (short-subunit alcohol dehydrogenase family)